jgi:flagellin-like protein
VGVLKNRRAVSPVIATLLMIAIAVAASVVMYAWVQTMIGSTAKQAQTTIRIDEVLFYNTSNNFAVRITIRNTGSVAAVIQTIYVYDSDTQIIKKDGIGYAIQAGTLRSVGITNATSWNSTTWGSVDKEIANVAAFALELSHPYRIKIVTDNGFAAEGTYYTPSEWS